MFSQKIQMLFLYNISLRASVKMSFGCTADCNFNLKIKTWRRRKKSQETRLPDQFIHNTNMRLSKNFLKKGTVLGFTLLW